MKKMKCYSNNGGCCKYKKFCKDEHPSKRCQERNCQSTKCEKRHPKPCRNYFLRRFCRFGSDCSFSHDYDCEVCDNRRFIIEKQETKVSNTIKDLKSKLKTCEAENKELKREIKEMKNEKSVLREENDTKSKKISELKAENKELKREIKEIKNKKSVLREDNDTKNKKISELKDIQEALEDDNKKLKEAKDNLEKENSDFKIVHRLDCMFCDFKSKKKSELQKHKMDEHQIKCDECNFKTFNEKELDEHMNNVHEIWKVTESFCDDYCNGAEGMHICFSNEDFENWKGFDMWEVDENLQTGETMYKCLDCNFKIETTEKNERTLQN